MNRNDLRRVDLNLLVVFEMLMHEQHVTRAADKLFVGQSTISTALNRLRSVFSDPLFIRTGRRMEPTTRACEIFSYLSPALDGISTALSRSNPFEPSTSEAVFRIGMSDDVEFALLPTLLETLRVQAPNVVLVVRRVNYLSLPLLLASGEISIGVSHAVDLPSNAKQKILRRCRIKVLRSDTAPGNLTFEEFCERRHAIVSFTGDLHSLSDDELLKLDCRRKVAIAIPNFHGLGKAIVGTQLIAIAPDYAVESLKATYGLRCQDLPFELPPVYELSMVWRGAQDADPAEKWMRSKIHEFMGAV